MKKQKQKKNYKYYYKIVLGHGTLTLSNKDYKKEMRKMIFIDMFFIIWLTILLKFPQAELGQYALNDSLKSYVILVSFLSYEILVLVSTTLHHIISLFYELKHKHQLEVKNIRGIIPKTLYSIYIIIHFPWILTLCFILRLMEKTKIENLTELLLVIVPLYFNFVIFVLMIFKIGIEVCIMLNNHNILPITTHITEMTYVYMLALISIEIGEKILIFVFKLYVKFIIPSTSPKYNRILKQYNLLNYYVLVIITLMLKAMNFSDGYKYLVDGLFYSTTAFSLISTAKEKAAQC